MSTNKKQRVGDRMLLMFTVNGMEEVKYSDFFGDDVLESSDDEPICCRLRGASGDNDDFFDDDTLAIEAIEEAIKAMEDSDKEDSDKGDSDKEVKEVKEIKEGKDDKDKEDKEETGMGNEGMGEEAFYCLWDNSSAHSTEESTVLMLELQRRKLLSVTSDFNFIKI